MSGAPELNTKPLDGRAWCWWCEDAPARGLLRLMLPDNDPVPSPPIDRESRPLCRACGKRFNASRPKDGRGVYIFEEDRR